MKPDKHFATAACIVVAAACLIALTWIGTARAIRAQNEANAARVTAALANQALTFTEQIDRQILALDQTLRILAAAWQADPGHFDLEAGRVQAVVLNGLSRDMVLTDENGIIRQSSVTEAINQNASGQDYFRALAAPSDPADRLFIGAATIDGIMRQWHMNVARALHRPDGSFAGVIDADYRIAAITGVFNQTDLGTGAFVALAGLDDGRLRGAAGPANLDQDASIADTPMFAAIQDAASGIWTGPSADDPVRRIHAFRRLPGRDLAVIVAMSEEEAMRPAAVWRDQARLFAACITALLTGLALALIQGARLARRRERAMALDRANLAAANAQLEFARALAAAKAEQLEATLAGMSDGVCMIDAQLCLVEWNARFPEIAGVPPEILRVGLPMEKIVRAQIETGQFGGIADPEAEVARRMARLRTAPYGVTQRQRPDGHTLELRRNRLPDGGFVTLFSDITEHKRAEEALRRARAAAEAANNEKSRFVAIVSHEIRTPLNALLNTIGLLGDSVLAPAQRALLTMARQSGDALSGLIDDILDLSQMEAGKLAIRPSLFALEPVLESSAGMFAAQAAKRGIAIRVAIAGGTPEFLLADPGRLRQVTLNLLSNAVKYARPGIVWLAAEPGRGTHEAVRIAVKDAGPVIAPDARERLFHPFSRLGRPGDGTAAGAGLGLSICHRLLTLMGGEIGCDAWRSATGEEGNAFWIALPATALPVRAAPAPADRPDTQSPAPHAQRGVRPGDLKRRPPRTRVLLVDDVAVNQLVTATLLRRQGHHVDIASSGPAAIRAMRATPYDLVFMDIFMPGMSGQEATRIIRALPEPARSTPVIALTANAGPEDAARFEAAGMDGLLAKPVSPAGLQEVLDRHVWAAPRPAGSPVPSPGQAAPSQPSGIGAILSLDRIDDLRSNLAPQTFANLVEECLKDMDHQLPALRRALAAGAPGAIAAHAHALAGMAAGYGMAALEARLRTIIAAARDGDTAPLGPNIAAGLEADFARTSEALREMLRSEAV